jgi:hypothetical protein
MFRTSRMLRRRRPKRLRREFGAPAWMFIMERAVERGLKLRPFRIYQGDLPGDRIDERATTVLIGCLRDIRR